MTNLNFEKIPKRNERKVSAKVTGSSVTDTSGKYRNDRKRKRSDYEATNAGWF